jgi:hypothetical protein
MQALKIPYQAQKHTSPAAKRQKLRSPGNLHGPAKFHTFDDPWVNSSIDLLAMPDVAAFPSNDKPMTPTQLSDQARHERKIWQSAKDCLFALSQYLYEVYVLQVVLHSACTTPTTARYTSTRVLTLAQVGRTATETKVKQPVNHPLLHLQRWYFHSSLCLSLPDQLRPFLSLSPPIQLRPGRWKCMIVHGVHLVTSKIFLWFDQSQLGQKSL